MSSSPAEDGSNGVVTFLGKEYPRASLKVIQRLNKTVEIHK